MRNRLERLWRILGRSQKTSIIAVMLLMLIAAAAEMVSIGLVIPFLGVLLNPEIIFKTPIFVSLIKYFNLISSDRLIFGITFCFVLCVLVAAVVRVLLAWSQIRLAYAIGSNLAESIYRHVLYQPYRLHADTNSSQVISSVSRKADQVVNDVVLPGMIMLSSSVLILAIAGVLAMINPIVAISAGVGFGMIYFVVMLSTRYRISRYGQVVSEQQTRVIKLLQEALGGIRDIIIDGAQDMYCRIYKQADFRLRRAQANNLIIGGVPRYLIEGVSVALMAILSCWIALKDGGFISMIPTIGVLVLGAQKILPLMQLSYVNFTQIQGGQAALEDVLQILEMALPAIDESTVISFEREIILNKISFRYKTESNLVVRDVSFRIEKGDRIGIVGDTGSGKSSLLDLIMGLLIAEKGEISVDGVFLSDSNSRAWQKHIAHVPQSIYLADTTVLENIAFGIPIDQIDYSRVCMAAEKAKIADVIESWEGGYYSIVGERGARMSGGQKQRIGLARALYKNADVLVLDEATSALDHNTEFSIMAAIGGLGSGVTVLMVTHRLATLKHCNKIIYLQNGAIDRIESLPNLSQ